MLNENKKLIPNSTQIPHIITDFIIPQLGLGEERCLLYICRRTYGFHKEEDKISLSQFINGITNKNGEKLDLGTGLSRPTVVEALDNLIEGGLIFKCGEKKGGRGNSNTYKLNLNFSLGELDEIIKRVNKSRSDKKEINKKRPKQQKLISVKEVNCLDKGLSSFTKNSQVALPKTVKKLNTQKKEEEREESNMSQATEFDYKNEIKKMLTDTREHIKIIGYWLREKGFKPENKEQVSSLIKRNCKPAMLLVGYKHEDIVATVKALKTTEYIKKFTLETVSKYIDDVIVTKPEASECKILKWEMVEQDGTQVMRPVYAN